MFEEQAKQELFETVKAFYAYKQEDGDSVSSYLLKMKSYLDTLECLGYAMPNELGIPKKAETPYVLAIREGKIQKDRKKSQDAKGKAKGKNKPAYAPKTKIPPPPKRDNSTKDFICHHCKEVGHWRRNCPSYHAELKKRKNASEANTSGIFTVELYAFSNPTWVYDMGCRTHISFEAIESFDLILPSSSIIVLDNFHFTPTMTRGVVSISCLVKNAYIHTFTNYGILVSKDNVFYFNAIPCDDIYEIDMYNLNPNISSNYNVSNKRTKHRLDSYYLWHCRLGHINKKCMDMFQRDGLLQPTHDESREKCKSCIYGKIGRKHFPHQMERAKDLLGLVHTDVCGPFRTMVSKRRNRTLLDMVRSMMNLTTLPKSFWGFAFETAARILNMVPTKKVDRTPYEIWHEKAPKLSYLRAWGSSESHGLLEISRSDKGLEIIQEEDIQPSENTRKEHNEVALIKVGPQNVRVPICRSIRIPQAPNRYGYYVDVEKYESWDLDEPPNYKVSLADPRSDKWLEAMNTKISSGSKRLYLNLRSFLNGHLSKDVEGFVDLKHLNKVCKLQRSIYGLKQASRSWNKRFDKEIKKIGFTQNPDKPCVYLKTSGSNVASLVLRIAYILGIKIIRDRFERLIALSQSAYLEKILKKFRMENSKKGYTPMMEKPDYRKSQGAKTYTEVKRMQRVPYALAIGSIIYATAVKTILKYLRNTKDMVLVYGAKPEDERKVSCYANASFQTDKDDTKSQTGYVFVLNGGAVD
uniref:CCHC-type domain-containing protein n=1 Tax=Tanacetum cinerariifolium TaxID=118510 RepID=A0A6L2NJE4_TANCI|nr:hypothetical protein [Tanacetum cinerariifolium]